MSWVRAPSPALMNMQKHGPQTRASAFIDAPVSIMTHLRPGRQYGMSRICHSRASRPDERRADPVPRLDVLPRRDVVVDVHRRARPGVTEALTHHFDVGARCPSGASGWHAYGAGRGCGYGARRPSRPG